VADGRDDLAFAIESLDQASEFLEPDAGGFAAGRHAVRGGRYDEDPLRLQTLRAIGLGATGNAVEQAPPRRARTYAT
jgi:hypothetical protein